MQIILTIHCGHCGLWLAAVNADTADLPEELQEKVNRSVLKHRQGCIYYHE